MLAPRETLPALSLLRHTNLTRRIDPRHLGTSEIIHQQKSTNSEFQNSDFFEEYPLRVDFRETIPAYLNFGHQHICFLYPKKLSYSSRNAYIKKIRVRELKANSSSQKPQKHIKTNEFVW